MNCAFCNKSFVSSEKLSDHLYNDDHVSYKCPYNECNQEHSMSMGMNMHLKIYHKISLKVEPSITRLAGKKMTLSTK